MPDIETKIETEFDNEKRGPTFVSRPIMYSNSTFLRYSISVASENASVPLNPGSVKSRKDSH